MRALLFQTYRIPSASMYGSLFEGDYVVINKLAYGPRLPITPIALKFNGEKKYLDFIHLPYFRLPGYSSIQRNDVLAFNYELQKENPVDMQEEFIKRCVALPGDSLQILNGNVYANSKWIRTKSVFNYYKVVSKKNLDTLEFLKAGILMDNAPQTGTAYSFLMSAQNADSLSKLNFIESVVMDVYKKENYSPALFPNNSLYPWNNDHFGPFWIPKKGDSIALTQANLILYQHCIEHYEEQILSLKSDSIFINGKFSKYYIFKKNYYFLMGDNRHNSTDSRVTGPIPEDHIIGKATFILFSPSPSRKFLKIN